MKNILGGFLGILVGTIAIVALLNLPDPVYSWPYSSFWFILVGSSALKTSFDGFLNQSILLGYVLTWVIVGIVISPFSKKGWNTLRTSLWAGIILGILSLASLMLLDPNFWISPTRNIDLFYHFVISFIVSLCAIPSAIPTTILIERLKKQSELPIPDKIETTCDCGAIFKSNPLICSECGRQLRERKD